MHFEEHETVQIQGNMNVFQLGTQKELTLIIQKMMLKKRARKWRSCHRQPDKYHDDARTLFYNMKRNRSPDAK